MNRRFLALLVALAAVAPRTAFIAGQVPAASAAPGLPRPTDPWKPVLGPDGHPDLQGVWLNNSATPLERPKGLEGRQFLTDDEVIELRKRADRLFKNTNADFAGGDAVFLAALANVDHFKSATATGTTFEMIEREFDNRTSLIVDPPDGRIPPLTAEAQQRRAAADARRRRPPEGPEDLSHVERCLTYGVPRLSGTNIGAGPLGFYCPQAPDRRRSSSRLRNRFDLGCGKSRTDRQPLGSATTGRLGRRTRYVRDAIVKTPAFLSTRRDESERIELESRSNSAPLASEPVPRTPASLQAGSRTKRETL